MSPQARSRPRPYVVSLELTDAPVLVVGGGSTAVDLVHGLRESGAAVTVVSPVLVDALQRAGVRWHAREYRRGEVASYRLAITATGIDAVDDQVVADAWAANVPVHVAHQPERGTFRLPGRDSMVHDTLATEVTGTLSPTGEARS